MGVGIYKTTLGLNLATDSRWANISELNIEDLLVDHAWCEQKAAMSGMALITQFADREKLLEVIVPIVAEEWSHFRMVLAEMKKRGINMKPKRIDKYVAELNKLERKGDKIDRQLMDKLLINAMIEARSAEKFKLLSEQIKDQELRIFYHELMLSEAGHYRSFINLAKEYMPDNVVDNRWKEMLIDEAIIISKIGVRAGEFH